MKKGTIFKLKLSAILFVLIFGAIYYYVTLPAINIHSPGLWKFVLVVLVIVSIVSAIRDISDTINHNSKTFSIKKLSKKNHLFGFFFLVTILVFCVFGIGFFLSSPVINAGKYKELVNISNGNFEKDIQQISYDEIPLLDKASAEIVGGRKMGTMVDYVSQFEVASDYTQINYKGKPVRITPLVYGNLLKWFTNRSDGIPAYISIDMATQNADCIKLDDGIKYSKSEHFGRLIYRYIRFNYPTYIFDNINLEIDENGTPYWICPVKDYTIGLFGGVTISNVVIVNAVTGEHTDYKVDEVPQWVDHVYSADLLISYYDYYGTLQHGYLNSILSQKGCLKTTEGYNYIALNDDVWVYTGITSVGGDESNVGFVLMNQRTAETKYYQIAGAEEFSAMSSAEGKVQNLGYTATFPLLLNISGEPTYFISLKDSAGLVKMYAMVNIQKYTVVATATTTNECERQYKDMLISNNIQVDDNNAEPVKTTKITGTITKLASAVVEGNTHYYIALNDGKNIYDIDVSKNLGIVLKNVGDTVSIEYNDISESDTENIYKVIKVSE
ncbi:MAG: CvpA family protein [Lachnospiraceae bacterium]|nr:CvpA family protein [Lachnoclostridium sp.]MDD7522215.1 CvpA family protein [Lachnoclostridium sp.]MDY2600013.1 CvpA family protein [Lachnospiraceae bacterium]